MIKKIQGLLKDLIETPNHDGKLMTFKAGQIVRVLENHDPDKCVITRKVEMYPLKFIEYKMRDMESGELSEPMYRIYERGIMKWEFGAHALEFINFIINRDVKSLHASTVAEDEVFIKTFGDREVKTTIFAGEGKVPPAVELEEDKNG